MAAECTSQGCAVGLCCACGALPQITAAEGTVHTAQTPYACNAAVLQQAAAQGLVWFQQSYAMAYPQLKEGRV